MPQRNASDTKGNPNAVDSLLRDIGTGGRPRDEETMGLLARYLEHPREITDSPFLGDDDPLKQSAIAVLEEFEAVTNGMAPSDSADHDPTETGEYDRTDPLYPWRMLTSAARSFYAGRRSAMLRRARAIPAATAPARLAGTFEILAGRPEPAETRDSLAAALRVRTPLLEDGLERLEEAASYPEILLTEAQRVIPSVARENREAAARLALWALGLTAEERPLNRDDAAMTASLGPGESDRLLSIASLPYDADRALIAWLRSLRDAGAAGGVQGPLLSARLGIASEIHRIAEDEGQITDSVFQAVADILRECMPMLDHALGKIPPPPDNAEGLAGWFSAISDSTADSRRLDSRREPASRRTLRTQTLELFDGVSY